MNKHKPFLKSELRQKINKNYLIDEKEHVNRLIQLAELESMTAQQIQFRASDLVDSVRKSKKHQGTIEAFIQEYDLSTEEGIVLMCMAEALLRIPDDATADKLIKDKITPANWQIHLGQSHSLFVNASTWGLTLSGKILKSYKDNNAPWEIVSQLINRLGEPIVRTVVKQAMRIMGSQFVMQTKITSAIKRSKQEFHKNYRFSYDMLGEAALCTRDAERYYASYMDALNVLAQERAHYPDLHSAPSLSIKLSALHPRYELAQYRRVMEELTPKILQLAQFAKQSDIGLTIDAEEAERLDISLDIFESVLQDDSLKNWNGFGLAVQAYQNRSLDVLIWLKEQSKLSGNKIPVRLVKGAYWDTEIKRAQERGLADYPVFTRKTNTDISYQACARFMLANSENFYPQFATHNAYTIASIIEMAAGKVNFEFQRLHGMGQTLYQDVIKDYSCRIYSPVGSYKDLLPYLVRRLLENGANTSFVNRIENENISIDKIIEDPVVRIQQETEIRNDKIPLPIDIFLQDRKNSQGVNLSDYEQLEKTQSSISNIKKSWQAAPQINPTSSATEIIEVTSPYDNHTIGTLTLASKDDVNNCLNNAYQHVHEWKHSPIQQRVSIVNTFANLLHEHRHELYALCQYEAGKSLNDAIAEVREAIDFCYYYSAQAELLQANEKALPGPTGEKNSLNLHGRGVFVCISPWNFPLAIYVGQIIAAFVTGNVVIAKPSSNTALTAAFATKLLYKAGADKKYFYFLPCQSSFLSSVLSSPKISGVAF
ncbi:MAG: bifunctional proline dehydrogenase/L-glutamate gamma-semialdehyde dehydrogenase PutA, partial [Gammaproteobacteria bacterium]|nr:bifunctional proline dehydrogenase/L-glutamate gamma-semialdehyde dehydrogenase PutA [Gammaproteobacteria bacterium]